MARTLRPGLILAAAVLVLLVWELQRVLACNETVCASLVSKCLLLDACECDLSPGSGGGDNGTAAGVAVTGSCYRDCYKCLHALYTECCSCVGMCSADPTAGGEDSPPSDRSSVEDLKEPIPDLFQVLTEEADSLLRWVAYTFPAHDHISFFQTKLAANGTRHFEFSVADPNDGGEVKKLAIEAGDLTINCTVAYMSQCMSMTKCKLSCNSMGASKYRWFHDGCCECIGHTCYTYGINHSRCLLCSDDLSEPGDEGQNVPEAPLEDYHDYDQYASSVSEKKQKHQH